MVYQMVNLVKVRGHGITTVVMVVNIQVVAVVVVRIITVMVLMVVRV